MVSQEVLDELESRELGYLLAVPLRKGWEEIHDAALSMPGSVTREQAIAALEEEAHVLEATCESS